jgi:hypothetical protein
MPSLPDSLLARRVPKRKVSVQCRRFLKYMTIIWNGCTAAQPNSRARRLSTYPRARVLGYLPRDVRPLLFQQRKLSRLFLIQIAFGPSSGCDPDARRASKAQCHEIG